MRCGEVRRGAVRCGAVRCGAVQCGVVRWSILSYGVVIKWISEYVGRLAGQAQVHVPPRSLSLGTNPPPTYMLDPSQHIISPQMFHLDCFVRAPFKVVLFRQRAPSSCISLNDNGSRGMRCVWMAKLARFMGVPYAAALPAATQNLSIGATHSILTFQAGA